MVAGRPPGGITRTSPVLVSPTRGMRRSRSTRCQSSDVIPLRRMPVWMPMQISKRSRIAGSWKQNGGKSTPPMRCQRRRTCCGDSAGSPVRHRERRLSATQSRPQHMPSTGPASMLRLAGPSGSAACTPRSRRAAASRRTPREASRHGARPDRGHRHTPRPAGPVHPNADRKVGSTRRSRRVRPSGARRSTCECRPSATGRPSARGMRPSGSVGARASMDADRGCTKKPAPDSTRFRTRTPASHSRADVRHVACSWSRLSDDRRAGGTHTGIAARMIRQTVETARSSSATLRNRPLEANRCSFQVR